MNLKMFGFLKNPFRKAVETQPATPVTAQPAPGGRATAQPQRPASHNAPASGARPSSHVTMMGTRPQSGRAGLSLPLSLVLENLPAELQMRTHGNHGGDAAGDLPMPMERVLPQLSRGAVRITFGELRQWAPAGTFTDGADADSVQVTLPLSEILARLSPALLSRRTTQKRVVVPDEIQSPFNHQGHAGGQAAPVAPSTPAAPAAPVRPAAAPQSTTPPARSVTPAAPQSPLTLQSDVAGFTFNRSTTAAIPAGKRLPSAPMRPLAAPPATTAMPGAQPKAPMPAPHPAPVPPPSHGMASVLSVPLGDLVVAWPDSVRTEIAQLGISRASVALPTALLELSLKSGRLAFSWKQIRSWVQPLLPSNVSANDQAMLELPLKLIAPLFLAQQKQARAQKKFDVDESIPNVFHGGGNHDSPETVFITPPVAHDTPKAADTNYFVWGDSSDTLMDAETVFKRGSSTPSTAFLKRYATPNEIVAKAVALPGVAGALITLPDGLLVASKIPAGLNADTVAGFLPQIYGKVSQCTKELRMGELNNLKFTVGRVPWRIYRVGAIFFAAFGREGERIPASQLAALACELDRNPQNAR